MENSPFLKHTYHDVTLCHFLTLRAFLHGLVSLARVTLVVYRPDDALMLTVELLTIRKDAIRYA